MNLLKKVYELITSFLFTDFAWGLFLFYIFNAICFYFYVDGSFLEVLYITLLWFVTGWINMLMIFNGIGAGDDMYNWISNNTKIELPYTSLTIWALVLIYFNAWFSFVYLFVKLWSIGATKWFGIEGVF